MFFTCSSSSVKRHLPSLLSEPFEQLTGSFFLVNLSCVCLQVKEVCRKVKALPHLQDGFNLVGFSQVSAEAAGNLPRESVSAQSCPDAEDICRRAWLRGGKRSSSLDICGIEECLFGAG